MLIALNRGSISTLVLQFTYICTLVKKRVRDYSRIELAVTEHGADGMVEVAGRCNP
jgi:hypothetical protein